MTTLIESDEHKALRKAVATFGKRYGRDYITQVVDEGRYPTELWQEAASPRLVGKRSSANSVSDG